MLTPTALRLSEIPAAAAAPRERALLLVDVARDADAAAGLAGGLLDAAERERLGKLRREPDRRQYAVAHVALRLVLGARLGQAPEAVELVREVCPTCGGPHGRPAVAGGRPHFSLSHSGDLVLIALAPRPVGVDVEQVPTAEAAVELAGALHPREAAELAELLPAAAPMAFGRAWARKEAFLKGLGTGLSRGPALDYVGTGARPVAPAPDWTLHDVAVPDGYAAAIALATTGDGAA